MRILGIETATPASSVALVDDRQLVASAKRVDRTGHGAFLVSALDFCFFGSTRLSWRRERMTHSSRYNRRIGKPPASGAARARAVAGSPLGPRGQ